MNEEAVKSREFSCNENLPPVIEWNLDELRAESRYRSKLCLWRVIRNHDCAWNTQSPRMPCNSLRHVARACGEHATCEISRVGCRDGVSSTPQLERSNRLKILELEINVRRIDVEPYERRANY